MRRSAQAGAGTPESRWREGSSDFISSALYALAWLLAPGLADAWLLALILGAALQLVFVTHYVAAIVPRSGAGWIGLLLGHALLFAILHLLLSRAGSSPVGAGAIVLAQLPLLLRSLMQRRHSPHDDPHWMLAGFGAFLVMVPALALAQALAAMLADTRLAGRSIQIPPFQPIGAERIEMALLFGTFFFVFLGLGRVFVNTRVQPRSELDDAKIAQWRREYERSRGRR
jgi:hypothetical protein